MGVFEVASFEAGTKTMMKNIVAATEAGFTTVIGGGDTATACKVYKTKDKLSTCPLVQEPAWSLSRARFCLTLPPVLFWCRPCPAEQQEASVD